MENWTRYWKKNPNQIALNTFKVQWTAQLRDSHEWRCECKSLCYWPAARPTLPPMIRSTYEKKILVILLLPLIMFPLLKKKKITSTTDRQTEWMKIYNLILYVYYQVSVPQWDVLPVLRTSLTEFIIWIWVQLWKKNVYYLDFLMKK